MTAEALREKTGRYLRGESVPSETRQIQTWLSCTLDKKETVSTKDKEQIENEIAAKILDYIAYSQFDPTPKRWWSKFTTFF
jgi:hypothetical protein